MAEADLSRLVSLILENPTLLSEIKSLASSEKDERTERTEAPEPTEPVTAVEVEKPKLKRSELLKALKPYISAERGRAIETMIGISDALEMIRGG